MSDPKKYIRFTLSFDMLNIISQIQLRSLYTGSHSSTQDGTTLEAMSSITDAELDMVEINLRDAASKVYQKLQAYTRLSDNPFQYDIPIAGTRTIIYELWLPMIWDTSLAFSLRNSIEKMMVQYCLVDWFTMTSQQIPSQVASSNYDTAEAEVKRILEFRKIPVMRPQPPI